MESRAIVRATELNGRAVIDLDCAEKVGKVDRIVLDPDARRVAAFQISRGASLNGESLHMTVPASSVRAIGPDALTIHHASLTGDETLTRFDNLPRASDLIGRKVVSEDGRVLGRVNDVLINREDGRILGYTLGGQDVLDKIGHLLRGDRRHHAPYLPAEAYVRTGDNMIIAPEGAVSDEWEPGLSVRSEIVCEWSQPGTETRALEPGSIAPGTSIRRAD